MNECRKQRLIREALGTDDPRPPTDLAIAPLAVVLILMMAASFFGYDEETVRNAPNIYAEAPLQ